MGEDGAGPRAGAGRQAGAFARLLLGCVAGLALAAVSYALALIAAGRAGGPPLWLPPVLGSIAIAVAALVISPRHPFLAALPPLLLPAVTFLGGSRAWGTIRLHETVQIALWMLLFGALPGLLVLAASWFDTRRS